jgi:site-specific DNA-methyltransferase (adenine-specific)
MLNLGDCLDPVTGLASLADKSIDVTITDPPYEAEAHTKGRRQKTGGHCGNAYSGIDGKKIVEAPLPFAAIMEAEREAVAVEIARVTRRWILVFCQVEASQRWAAALAAGGAGYIRTMAWIKPDGQPQFTGDRPGMGYESIVVAHRPGRKRWNGGGRVGVFEHVKNNHNIGAPHPTTKPLPLMRELVELFTDPDELICDPFAGSGSTGVACKQLGRRFLGWERDAEYHRIATARLAGADWRVDAAQTRMF